jgi:hypothetical protein
MALFTDGPPSSIEDLSAQDAQLTTVATVEGMEVTQKLALAWEDVGLNLDAMLKTSSGAGEFWQSAAPNLKAVVVTPPLRLWHTFRTLELFYADVYNNQLNDRYAGKRDYFGGRASWAHERLMELGVGTASLPLSRAAQATVNAAPPVNLALPDGTYYVTTAWVNQNYEEGAAGDVTDLTIANSTLAVTQGAAPQNAVGWNVYVGSDPSATTLQNTQPLGTAGVWVQPRPVTAGGRTPGTGQPVSFLKVIVREIQRG